MTKLDIEGPITPCGDKSEFDEESVTVENGIAYFWYNTADGSTHVLKGENND